MKKNTVLFDFDGTLMDTNDIIMKSWQHTFRTIEGKERPKELILETYGEPLELTMRKFFPDFGKTAIHEAIDTYRGYQVHHYKELIHMFPGTEQLVRTLKRKDYKVALVTSRLRNSTESGLEKFGLLDQFDYIVTADDTEKHKPDPEPVLIALDKLNSRPPEAVMVGDSMFDILCAQNAGVEAVLVGWAVAAHAQRNVVEIKPEYRIETAEELLGILQNRK